MKKHSDKSKSNSDAGSSFERVEPQSSGIKHRVSDFSGSPAAAEEAAPPEQQDLTEAPLPLASWFRPGLPLLPKGVVPSSVLFRHRQRRQNEQWAPLHHFYVK